MNMKLIATLCLATFLPALAIAEDAPAKPALFEPISPEKHTGLGKIGVRLVFDKATGVPTIAAITRGSPALDFGLKVGDVIIRIDKNYTSNMTEDEVHLALRGEPGTGVELTILRDDDPHLIIRALERRIIFADAEEMVQPPLTEIGKFDPTPVPVK